MRRLCANKVKEIWPRKGTGEVPRCLVAARLHLRIPGAESQNGGRGRHAEKAGCEKQGGPLESRQFCKENSLTDQSGSLCCGKVVG